MPLQTASAGATVNAISLGQPFLEFPLGVQGGMVGDSILPLRPTGAKSGSFYTVTRESILRTSDGSRAARSAYGRDTYDLDKISYSCEEYGWESPIDDSERAFYMDYFDADEVARGSITTRAAIAREKRIAAAIFNTSTWTGASLTTDLGTDWDSASSTIVTDILTAKEKVRALTGMMPNTMVVSAVHVANFMANTDLKARIAGAEVVTQTQVLQALQACVMIPKILLPYGVYNSAKDGATFTSSDIWSDDYCWIGVTANTGSLAEPCVGRTMTWTEDGGDFTWDNYYEPQTRSTVWRGRYSMQEKVFDASFGHLLVIDT